MAVSQLCWLNRRRMYLIGCEDRGFPRGSLGRPGTRRTRRTSVEPDAEGTSHRRSQQSSASTPGRSSDTLTACLNAQRRPASSGSSVVARNAPTSSRRPTTTRTRRHTARSVTTARRCGSTRLETRPCTGGNIEMRATDGPSDFWLSTAKFAEHYGLELSILPRSVRAAHVIFYRGEDVIGPVA